MKYIVPEYYKYFRCKCSECHHSCCDEWRIRISIKEYYRLLGIECSDKLRARLDCALKVCPEPSNESYAYLSTDWRGTCTLHQEDGLCSLQAELGESILPEICRLYPRSTQHLKKFYKCTCSNSCEEVVELLMKQQAPLRFEDIELSVVPEFEINLTPHQFLNCRKAITIMQNRSLPLPERFTALGNYLSVTDFYIKKPEALSYAFQIFNTLINYFADSISIQEYCKTSQSFFCIDGREQLTNEDLKYTAQKYKAASMYLESLLPDWQITFEQLIVNHMFFSDFPYLNDLEWDDSFLSLAAVFSFLKLNLLAFISDKNAPDKIVDFFADMFRLIEHSDFENIAVHLLKEMKYSIKEYIPQLIYV